MENLFDKKLNKTNWATYFQDISVFKDLIVHIFKNEGLNIKSIGNLTPGTNAVFKVDSYVIKIFAPIETGYSHEKEYLKEKKAMEFAYQCGVKCPSVISTGVIHAHYHFFYIIMAYVDGMEIKQVIKEYGKKEKIELVQKLSEMTSRLNKKIHEPLFNDNIKEVIFSNKRWDIFSFSLKNQVFQMVKNLNILNYVYVHGDLTCENVLVNKENDLVLLDFADSTIAPIYYEYPPLFFDLFDFDAFLMKRYMKVMEISVEDIFNGLIIHPFGPHFIKEIYRRLKGEDILHLHDINEIKSILHTYVSLS